MNSLYLPRNQFLHKLHVGNVLRWVLYSGKEKLINKTQVYKSSRKEERSESVIHRVYLIDPVSPESTHGEPLGPAGLPGT